MALVSPQPVTEMSIRIIFLGGGGSGGEGGRCIGLTTLPTLSDNCLEILGTLTSRKPEGLSRHLRGLLYHYLVIFQPS